ncbi:hypothetical protein BKP37_02455 [Anaerobacillus alkalilacustris]|uniref:Uncharacterized protein n=1 Tax=Anaerobacillus alkalilacustris TaxID=393763 RepID=A0A1S2M127_9BACI|nr:hypothetical protein BKP37_02455 [Anaerobacillus alkalilacustris]
MLSDAEAHRFRSKTDRYEQFFQCLSPIGGRLALFLREAGKKVEDRLKQFLDKYAATMPRVTLRYANEKLDKRTKKHYMTLGKLI